MEYLGSIYWRKRSKFRGTFSGICAILLIFAYHERGLQNPILKKPFSNISQNINSKDGSIYRRKVFENHNFISSNNPPICSAVYQHKGYDTKCAYMRDNPQCNSGGFFNYIEFFYCDCSKYEVLGYIVLVIWLLVMFYLLGNTAADYFCCCLEMLSSLLKLAPTVAGVTLLPLGNGAPDVFSSIASFVGRDSGDVGLNSVLGGAVFVTCIVVGTVSFCVAEHGVRIEKKCFVRDVGFFLVTLVVLLVILAVGEVSVGGAIAFVSIYMVYALCVGVGEILKKHGGRLSLWYVVPLLPVTGSVLCGENSEDESICDSLLRSGSEECVPRLRSQVPHQLWASHVAIYSHEKVRNDDGENSNKLWGWNEEDVANDRSWFSCSRLCSLLEFPLMLPRRLTIPIVEEERWSKVYGVASASLAPMLLAFLWSTQNGSKIIYIIGAVVGGILGLLAYLYTETDHPPRRFLFPWVLGGFFMSIIWFYMIANELVSLFVAFGVILGIKSSLLALTILAWGNSLGDLMSNVAIAMNGGDGVQVAISGCYAGPMFNTLIGLGISLLLGAWFKRPSSYIIPRDASLYYTLGFLVLGLVWSLILLPINGMRPGKWLGAGLIVIYLVFLTVRASMALGDGSLDGSS